MRHVLLHYHLFKNAGTSLDAVLKNQFGDAWVTREFPANPDENRRSVAQWIAQDQEAICFSSHTALLPPPTLPNTKVWPVIFVRHPIDRIASAYEFESRQGDDGFGPTLARNTNLAGYIKVRLSIKNDRQCRNFHAQRLAHMYPLEQGPEDERALLAANSLAYVGLVEKFDDSLAELVRWLQEPFPDFNLPKYNEPRNASPRRLSTLSERLARTREEIGGELWNRLVNENALDLAIHENVSGRYADACAALDRRENPPAQS